MSSPPGKVSWRLLVDENLPRSLAQRLRSAGHDVEDTRGVRLRGRDDAEVFAYAQAHGRTILTLDKGIGNIQRYPKPHAGIVAARLPERLSLTRKVEIIVTGLGGLSLQTLSNSVVIIEPSRVRVRS
jgi:predicted nuclease of predicted toxin-antitoxin system